MANIDWSLLRVFLAIAETGSLTAAARQLRASQPTLGRQIAALEAAAGHKLFVRLPRGMALTPTGEVMLDAARRMRQAAADIDRSLAGSQNELSGPVRISASENIAVHWLPRVFAQFRKDHPGIALSILATNRASDLNQREADIAIRLFRMTAGDFIARRLGHLAQGIYASTEFIARHGRPESLDDLDGLDHVGFGEMDTQVPIPQVTHFRELIGARAPAFASNSLQAQYHAIRAGHGFGVLSRYIADPDPDLCRILPNLAIRAPEAWAVVHADLRHAPRIKLVYETLIDLFDRDRALFEGK